MKKNVKHYYLVLLAALTFSSGIAQTRTVCFKPGPDKGQDAQIRSFYGCSPNTYPAQPENMNFGSDPKLRYLAWTFSSPDGCPEGVFQSLIKFGDMTTIPPGATITNATLTDPD